VRVKNKCGREVLSMCERGVQIFKRNMSTAGENRIQEGSNTR
jgi:hypothetical protein